MKLISGPRRRFFAPEVVQTSAMDCGPASLKCLLEGFGIHVGYGRLREACQTDVDGTSIDTIEELSIALGLDAEQNLVPPEHLLLDEARALPAIVVLRMPNGGTHFVVVWSCVGDRVQMMDPAIGRRWLRRSELLADLFVHAMPVPADALRGWLEADDFQRPLARRLAKLGVPSKARIATANGDPTWRSIAALDAAVRMVEALVRSGGAPRGAAAARLVDALFERAQRDDAAIPDRFWSARPHANDDGGEQASLRGAVVVRIRGRTAATGAEAVSLSPELAAALHEAPARPLGDLLALLRDEGALGPLAIVTALAFGAVGRVIEAVLLRGVLQVGQELRLGEQRLTAACALIVVLIALVGLEVPASAGLLRLGRRLEASLRIAFFRKIPRLGDRYFQSRPLSDMAERGHAAHLLRAVPSMGGDLLRATLDLVATTLAIAWVDPASGAPAAAAAVVLLAAPLAMNRTLIERDLRVRTHTGALTRFYLDALLGLVPIRAHGAQRTVRREHEGLLVEHARAGRSLVSAVTFAEAWPSFVGFAMAAWILFGFVARNGAPAKALLLLYWALALPTIGREIAATLRRYPEVRNVTLRLLEPLGAPEDARRPPLGGRSPLSGAEPRSAGRSPELSGRSPRRCAARPGVGIVDRSNDPHGVGVSLQDVTVRAGGHTILDGVTLELAPGSHVAVVGSSGAGKSSLVGLLLGWHRAASGRVLVDGAPLDEAHLDRLREATAWVDPAVQLHHRSLLENLRYGASDDLAGIASVLEAADLRGVLERLPEGQQTALGEGGALVSGGEGQRVRFGRALGRSGARLAILDEPFRGLDRAQRRSLLARARETWRRATLLCITHDVGETRDFERVIVVEGGRVVEDGRPSDLAALSGSRYAALLAAEEAVRERLWTSAAWRTIRFEQGKIIEGERAREGRS